LTRTHWACRTKGLVVQVVARFLKGIRETVIALFAPGVFGNLFVMFTKRTDGQLALWQSEEGHADMQNTMNDELSILYFIDKLLTVTCAQPNKAQLQSSHYSQKV
jgi:hypothetical protein